MTHEILIFSAHHSTFLCGCCSRSLARWLRLQSGILGSGNPQSTILCPFWCAHKCPLIAISVGPKSGHFCLNGFIVMSPTRPRQLHTQVPPAARTCLFECHPHPRDVNVTCAWANRIKHASDAHDVTLCSAMKCPPRTFLAGAAKSSGVNKTIDNSYDPESSW